MTATVPSTAMRPERWPPGRRRDHAFASIVHVNEKGGSFGGTEEYIALVTAALSTRGVRSHLVCGAITGELPSALSSVRIVEGLAHRRPPPGTADALAGVIADLDADVIYLHNVFDPAAVSAVAALAGRGTLIWYVHDHYLTCLSELRWRRDLGACPHRLGRGCLAAVGEGCCVLRYPDRVLDGAVLDERLALSRSLAAADAVVVVSDYMHRLLGDAEPALAERLHLLSRPIRDLGDRRPRHRDRGDPAVITYAGRITPEKGLHVVIAALGATIGDAPIELRIAGVVEDEGYWSSCQALWAAAVAANPRLTVSYLGHLDYEDTDEQFRQSDIVAIPSQWPEPLGAVALEAMSAGAAVVASRIGGLDTTLVDGRNGFLVKPDDAVAWSQAFGALLDSPIRAHRFGRRAHRDVAGLVIGDHLGELDRLVAPRRGPGRRLAVVSDRR